MTVQALPAATTSGAATRVEPGPPQDSLVASGSRLLHSVLGDGPGGSFCAELIEDEILPGSDLGRTPGVLQAGPMPRPADTAVSQNLLRAPLLFPPAPHSARALARSVSLLS